MAPKKTPCAMCGATEYVRTRQHVLKKEWRKRYPWINTNESGINRHNPDGSHARERRPVDFLNQQVGPFCPPCNNVFMLSIEDGAESALDRLFTSLSLTIRANEIEPLRRWAYQTMLVRSLLDRSDGMQAPEKWFRDFWSSGGTVPDHASILIARVNSGAIHNSSRPHTMRLDGIETVVFESSVLVGMLLVMVGMHDETTDDARNLIRKSYERVTRDNKGRIAWLHGEQDIQLEAPLLWQKVSAVRAPSDTRLINSGSPESIAKAMYWAAKVYENIGSQDREVPFEVWPAFKNEIRATLEDREFIVLDD